MSNEHSLQEAADLLGVHYMTAYRYVRLGLLDARKERGVWCISDAAIAVFRSGEGAGPVVSGTSAPWTERLEERLINGDGRGAWTLIESAMVGGMSARDVYLEMLGPAMVQIGQRWSDGELDVAAEHQASVIAARVTGRLSPQFARRGRTLGDLVVGAPVGEFHALPSTMVGDLMREHGWNVRDVGANTPPASFVHAGRSVEELRGVGISISYVGQFDAVDATCAALRAEFDDVVIVLGGRAARDNAHARSLGADAVAASAEEFHDRLMAAPTQSG